MPNASPNFSKPDRKESRPDEVRYQPLVMVLVAVCVGIFVDRYRPMSVFWWWTLAAAAWTVWLALWRKGWDPTAAVLLLVAVAATAASWHHCRWYLFADDDLGCYARTETQPVCVDAIALKAPRVVSAPEPDPMRAIPQGDYSRLDVELIGIRDGTAWQGASGRARLSVDGLLGDVAAGDRLRVFAQLAAPRPVQNPGQFDFAGYLRADRQRSLMRTQFPECISVIEPGRGWGLWRLIDRARSHGGRLLQQHLNPRRSALASAVLLGARERLNPDRKQAFMQTGTIHLLAISGLHLGIVAGALLWMMRRAPIPRGWAMLSVAAFAVFYMLLTDARPPVIRATILVLMVCASLYFKRQVLSFNSLAAAALIVLALNPAELFHTGCQLSFLAVAGLMWFGPGWIYSTPDQDPLDRLIAGSRGWIHRTVWLAGRSVRHLTLVSATIWLLTLPLVMARFHLIAPVAVPVNTLLWVPMATALISGFATLVFGTVFAPLGQACGSVCDANLWLLDFGVAWARDLPGSHFWIPGPADWWLVGFYGGLGLLAAFPRIRPPRRWFVALLAGWTAVGFASAGLRHDGSRLDATFLSMGHGCAVVLELPSGQTMLYDAGQFGSPVTATRSIAEFLWSRGITHLDAVVISHGDLDHYNALPGLLERFSVGVIYVSPMMWENDNPAMEALREAIRQAGVPLREICSGDLLNSGGCRIEVLHPPRRGVLGGDNANSIVLDIAYCDRHILLPGDLDSPGLEDVLAEEPTDCDVLLAPHHGSRNSNPPGLSAWSTPEWVIISGSLRWDLGPIEAAYRVAGAEVIHTGKTGAVTVVVCGSGVSVEDPLLP